MTIGSKQKCVHVPYFLFKLFGEIGLFFYLRKGLFGVGYIDPFSSPSRWLLPFKHPLAPWHCWYKQCPIASERKGWAAMGPAPASFGNVAGFFVIWWYPKFIKDHHKFTTYYSLEAKNKTYWNYVVSFPTFAILLHEFAMDDDECEASTHYDTSFKQWLICTNICFKQLPPHVGPVVGGSSQGEVSQVSFKLRFTEKGTGHPITEKQKVSINHIKESIILSRVTNPPACKYNVLKTSRYIC